MKRSVKKKLPLCQLLVVAHQKRIGAIVLLVDPFSNVSFGLFGRVRNKIVNEVGG